MHQSIPWDAEVHWVCHAHPCTKNSEDKWKNHFFKMKGGCRDLLELQKGKNKEWLLSRATQNHMTPSLYLSSRIPSTGRDQQGVFALQLAKFLAGSFVGSKPVLFLCFPQRQERSVVCHRLGWTHSPSRNNCYRSSTSWLFSIDFYGDR